MPAWTVVPFAGLLLSIALLPGRAPAWWRRPANQALVAAAWAAPVAAYLLWRDAGVVGRAVEAYVAYIAMVGSIYVAAGNVYVLGGLRGTPRSNAALLLAGAVLASLIGPAAASLVLVRPLVRANADRTRVRHIVVFFILVVSNGGGLLTPLSPGLWPVWLVSVGALVGIFLLVEARAYRLEGVAAQTTRAAGADLRVPGLRGAVFLAAIVGAVLFARPGVREAIMLAAAVGSVFLIDQRPRLANRFTYGPLRETAILFAGLFVTMAPALEILRGVDLAGPWRSFWAAGLVSLFVGGAPAYAALAPAAAGDDDALAAIRCGAVLMGATSYVGSATNLLVKGIADEAGVPMPTFVGYMLAALAVTLPTCLLVAVVFFW